MRDDELKQLLERAESDWSTSAPAAGDLANRVRARQRARRQTRRVLTAVGCVVLVAAVGWRFSFLFESDQSSAVQVAQTDLAHEVAELRRLQEQNASELRVVKRMLELERAARQRADRSTTVDYQPTVAEQRDEVAYRMILQADSLSETMQPSERAVQIYRRVLELYPSSSSAELARERLSKLDLGGGNI